MMTKIFSSELNPKKKSRKHWKREVKKYKKYLDRAFDELRETEIELRITQERLAERDDQLRDWGNDLDVLKRQLAMAEQMLDLKEQRYWVVREQYLEGCLKLAGYSKTPQPAPEPRDGSDQDQETESKSNIVLLCQSAKLLKIRSIYETWERKKKNAVDTLADMVRIGNILKGDPKDYVDVGETQETGSGQEETG